MGIHNISSAQHLNPLLLIRKLFSHESWWEQNSAFSQAENVRNSLAGPFCSKGVAHNLSFIDQTHFPRIRGSNQELLAAENSGNKVSGVTAAMSSVFTE